MKKIVLFLLISFQNLAQSFTAETGYIFLSEPKGNFFGTFKIQSGTLKKTDDFDIYAETGRKFEAKITKLRNLDNIEINQAKAGESVSVDFFVAGDASNGKDYLRQGYKVYPKGFVPKNTSTTAKVSIKKTDFTTQLDGKPFLASTTYKGASYWRKGVKNMAYNLPYLQLQFACASEPDDRILTFQIFNPNEAPAKYGANDLEVNFSGNKNGKKEDVQIFGFVKGKGSQDFTVEITKWQKVTANKAIISGKVNGTIKEILILGRSKNTNLFENGLFENIEVEVFNEEYDLKNLIKGANK